MQVNWTAVAASVLPNIGGIAGGFITRKEIKGWYTSLVLPKWRPPNAVFGPVWTTLYTGMGYASYLVWRDGGGFEGAKLPLTLYGSQLILNWAWTPIFFGTHNLSLALYEIGALYANVAVCGYYFYQVNKTAGYLFIPYLGWLTIATALSYVIYRDNKKAINAKSD